MQHALLVEIVIPDENRDSLKIKRDEVKFN